MGMAAGQARLLSITARLSDNEQNGQALSFAKQRLADEADQINREYNEALNATKLTVLTGFNGSEAQYTDISYGLLTEYNKLMGGKQYLVTNQKGQILVTNDMKTAYESGNGDFNKFINYFGLSQNDVDFASTTITAEDKYQAVHDAWDKYLTSVGLSFENFEHDIEEPDVVFSWNTVSDSPQIESKYVYAENFSVATFKNEKTVDGQKVAIIEDLPLGETYEMRQMEEYRGWHAYLSGSDGNIYPRYAFNAHGNTYWFEYDNEYGSIYLAEVNKQRDAGIAYLSTSTLAECLGSSSTTSGYTFAMYEDPATPDYLVRAGRRPMNFDGTTQEQRELYDYAVALTKAYAGQDDCEKSVVNNPDNASEIKYYRNIFDQMQQFGYVTEEDMKINQAPSTQRSNVVQTGTKDNNWFEQQLRQGKLLLKTYDATKGTFVNTTYAEDSNIQEVEDDRRIAKAQIDYDQAQTALERKDKKIDLELKKLDTEHNALQTEYDSVKGIIDKNIEKSFNIFS